MPHIIRKDGPQARHGQLGDAHKDPAPLLKFCNCATCDTELLGDSLRNWWEGAPLYVQAELPRPVEGRINGRPYCKPCYWKQRAEA